VWVVVTGHEAVTMMAAALTLALLSFGYAPLARTRVWAREHLADLWAMLLLMAVMALGRAEPTFPNTGNIDSARLASGHGHGMGGAGAGIVGLSGLAAIALVAGWALARVLIARRGWHTRSLVSAAVCGAGLLWMLLL
jgi:hypothetical protein